MASRRWLVFVFYNILDIAAVNSWILFNVCKSEISRRSFILNLVNELRLSYCSKKLPACFPSSSETTSNERRQWSSAETKQKKAVRHVLNLFVGNVKKFVLRASIGNPVLMSTMIHKCFMIIFSLKIKDERKGEFIVEGQILLAWMDERFTWEDSQVTKIRVSSKQIWMPSIYIYNAIEPEEMTLEPLPVIIQRGVFWAPRYTIRTRCIPNLRYYPFDKNVCDIVIAPRNIEEDFLSINISSQSIFYKGFIKTKDMLDNPRWDYDDPKVYVKKIKIDNDFERDVVVYSFPIQRSMPLIPLGILTPCMACSLIFLTTFWMEAGSTLRAGLCVTSTLVCSSCLFTLSKILPASGSSTPIIVEYVSITLILSAFSSIQATLTTVFRRCEMLPPVSYATIISKIPSWCLVLMGIVPEKVLSQQLDQKFLFSELDDHENRQVYIKEDNPSNGEQSAEPLLMQSLWIKYIILFDRALFYLLGIIFILFVISVIVTE